MSMGFLAAAQAVMILQENIGKRSRGTAGDVQRVRIFGGVSGLAARGQGRVGEASAASAEVGVHDQKEFELRRIP